MLIGLDGSPSADEALEQAVMLGHRFSATLVVVYVQEIKGLGKRASDGGQLLERAQERVQDAGLAVETIQRQGDPAAELANLAHDVDTVLLGRRGRSSHTALLGATVTALIRIAEP